jgi:hypothetical protein
MEDIINQIDEKVQIIFEKSGELGTFRDAIWMQQAEYAATSPESIEAIKEQRYQNWLMVVSPPAVSE